MGFYDDKIVPWLVDVACGVKDIEPARRETAAELHGTVLEIGFGSGLNLPFLPAPVTQLLAVDPSQRGRELARRRLANTRVPVQFVGLDAQAIKADSASADCALCTFTLCTIADPLPALHEVKRILKPGGRLYLLEHGRAPDPGVRRWQDRLNGLQRTLCGGCNLNRDLAALVQEAGLRFQARESGYLPKTPRTHGFVTRAVAFS
jgi:SAM-dependent methyltransferase